MWNRRREQVHIQLNNINVNAIETDSGVFVGSNTQWGWSTHSKNNEGFGSVIGTKNIIYKNINFVDDQDLIDTPIDDRDIMLTTNGSPKGI